MKTCIGCKFAEWRMTKAQRLHPNGDGECTKIISIPELPQSMYWIGGTPDPARVGINRKKNMPDHCVYWQPNE